MAAASTSTDVPPLGKYLASTDKKIRDKAIKSLAVFLSDPSHDVLPQAEMAKLWKGIFYCFWMSDKPLVQQALATEIAEIILTIPKTSSSLAFLRGFWESMVREWSGIDRLRIDKYYMLIRRFVNASFRLLMRAEWEESVCAEYNAILTKSGGPLCADVRVPTSLACHLADIYLEELDKALATSSASDPLPAPIVTLFNPFYAMLANTTAKATFQRIQTACLEPLLSAISHEVDAQGEDEDEDEEGNEERAPKRRRLSASEYENMLQNACATSPKEGAMGKAALKKAVLRRIFEVASEEGTKEANRRKLYAFVKSHADDDEDE